MTLEQQVTSLELSKKLRELGVKQESVWYWGTQGDLTRSGYGPSMYDTTGKNGIVTADIRPYISAFTVAELGLIMHEKFRTFRRGKSGLWYYNQHGKSNGRVYGPFETEADARATCIIKRAEAKETYNAISPKI